MALFGDAGVDMLFGFLFLMWAAAALVAKTGGALNKKDELRQGILSWLFGKKK